MVASGLPIRAEAAGNPDTQILSEARQGLVEILNLWRDEMYDALYLRTILSGRHGREYFIERLVNSTRRPACCWEMLQEISSAETSADRVTIVAKVGIETEGVGTAVSTKTFNLYRRDGTWKIPMADILSLLEPFGYRVYPRKIIEKPLP
jgi:hypothetical protein